MNTYLWNYFFALIITSSAFFLLGSFIILKGPRRKQNLICALWIFAIFTWSFFQAWIGIADNEKAATLFQRITHVGVQLIPVIYLHFVLIYLGLNKIPREKFLLRLNYGISLFFILFIPTSYFLKGVNTSGPLKFVLGPGILYPYSAFWLISCIAYTLYRLLKAYLHSQGRLRKQIKCLFWGGLIGYPGGISNYLYVFGSPLPIINPYFTYSVLMIVVLIIYAVVKYRFLDIEVELKNTVIYGLVYSFSIGIFSFLVIFFGQWVVYGSIDKRIIWMCLMALFIITAMVRPLDAFLTRLTDKILFKRKYDYQKTLKEASAGMAAVRDLDKLLNLMVKILTKHVQVSHATIFLLDPDDIHSENKSSKFYLRASGGRIKLSTNSVLTGDKPIVWWLNRKKDAIVFDELDYLFRQYGLTQDNRTEQKKIADLIKHLEEFKTNLCIPSFFEGKLIGFLLLGEKLSQGRYTQEDIDIFMTLANHAASAIKNCWAYEELKEKEKQLIEAEKLAAIGRLAGNIAHEIKNPLAPIKTLTEFLDEKIDDPDFRKNFKKVIVEEVDRINHIVQALIDYAHPKKINKVRVDIRQIIESALSLLENDLHRQNIRVTQDYHSSSHIILADRERLKQVFLNLFLNSFQAVENISNKHKELRVQTSINKKSLIVKIQDTGCGIKKEELPFIFDPLFSTKEKGSGLGLSIVQSIVKNHGGTISAESQINVGTTFSISLPIAH